LTRRVLRRTLLVTHERKFILFDTDHTSNDSSRFEEGGVNLGTWWNCMYNTPMNMDAQDPPWSQNTRTLGEQGSSSEYDSTDNTSDMQLLHR